MIGNGHALESQCLDCSANVAGVSVPSEKAVWQWMSHPTAGGSKGITYPVLPSIVTSFQHSPQGADRSSPSANGRNQTFGTQLTTAEANLERSAIERDMMTRNTATDTSSSTTNTTPLGLAEHDR